MMGAFSISVITTIAGLIAQLVDKANGMTELPVAAARR